MLACARLGAVHSVVFGGFASFELASRIKDAQPKVILSASCGLEGMDIISCFLWYIHCVLQCADGYLLGVLVVRCQDRGVSGTIWCKPVGGGYDCLILYGLAL